MKNNLKEIWLEEYIGKDGLCILCKNSGYIKNENKKICCICPNGRQLKKLRKIIGNE